MQIKNRIGQYIQNSAVAGDVYDVYIPKSLPFEPALEMGKLYPLLDQAMVALGRLDGMSMVLPDASLFLYMYVRKEAVLSSQIEGTQSSLSDLLLFENQEAPGAPIDDVTEVSCYVSALNYGLKRLKEIPLSLRLIKEIHNELMKNSRGGGKQPGEFRRSQNWIGGIRPSKAKFVPPSPDKVLECLSNLEAFLHNEDIQLPTLIKAAIVHVQFETIHPFLDGNGRLGRLLITFILCSDGLLKEPLLYLSLYLKANRQTYYDLLQEVRETGDWETWVEFFLTGVAETATQATQAAKDIIALFNTDREKIQNSGRSTAGILTIHEFMQRQPIANTTRLKNECSVSLPTVLRSMAVLQELGIVREITGKERHKIFVYQDYLDVLNRGAEPFSF